MPEAKAPIVWEPDEEEEEDEEGGGVLLTWAVWADPVLEVLVLWSPEELLEELEVCEEEEEEEEGAVVGLRWHKRELSKGSSERFGAEKGSHVKKGSTFFFFF